MLTFKAVAEALTKAGITPERLFNEEYQDGQIPYLNEELNLDGAIELVETVHGDSNDDERNTFAFPSQDNTIYLSVTKRGDKFPTGFEDAIFRQMLREEVVTYRPFNNEREA